MPVKLHNINLLCKTSFSLHNSCEIYPWSFMYQSLVLLCCCFHGSPSCVYLFFSWQTLWPLLVIGYMSKATVNILSLFCEHIFVYIGKISLCGTGGHRVGVCCILEEAVRLSPRVVVSLTPPQTALLQGLRPFFHSWLVSASLMAYWFKCELYFKTNTHTHKSLVQQLHRRLTKPLGTTA